MKKLLTLVLAMVMMLSLSVSAFATESVRSLADVQQTNESEPVQVIQSDVGIFATWSIDWSISGGYYTWGTNQFNLKKGAKIPFKLEYSPVLGSIRVGLYDRGSEKFIPLVYETSSPVKGTLEVPADGVYSFAIENQSDRTIKVTGSYEY